MKLNCHKCGYSWEYRGKLYLASCPSCQAKVKTRKERRPVKP